MRKLISLALAALMILMAMPALADEPLTNAEFMYRYMALLSLSGVQPTSDGVPVAETQDGMDTMRFDRCMTVTQKGDDTLITALMWWDEGTIPPERYFPFLRALDSEYEFDESTNITDDSLEVIKVVGDAMVQELTGMEILYCGYTFTYSKTDEGTNYLMAVIDT